MNNKKLNEFDKKGFVIVKNLFSKSEIKLIYSQLEQMIDVIIDYNGLPINKKINLRQLNEKFISSNLFTCNFPDPDLLVQLCVDCSIIFHDGLIDPSLTYPKSTSHLRYNDRVVKHQSAPKRAEICRVCSPRECLFPPPSALSFRAFTC